jgi:ribosomal protein L11 methyltransferase
MVATAGTAWHVTAWVRGAEAADAVFALLDHAAGAVSAFETGPEEWRLEAYPRSPVLTARLAAELALVAAGAGGALVESGEEKLTDRDWLAENQASFPPLRVGRFFIYGSHYSGAAPVGTVGITVDAATAFGTGEHPSTRACLIALQQLARRYRFRRPLDIGTGTGILSIAAAKLLRCKVLASDIDRAAVDVARHNVSCNGVASLVLVRRAPGYRDRAVRRSRHDLILSNILARPLAVMAVSLAANLAPGGRAVLSGLLRRQEPIVLAPHRGSRIVLEQRLVIEGWSTLVMRRRSTPEMEMEAEAPISRFGSVKRPVRLPYAARNPVASEVGSQKRSGRAYRRPRLTHRFANGGFRYRPASDRRATSARRRPVPGDATRRTPSWPTKQGSLRT